MIHYVQMISLILIFVIDLFMIHFSKILLVRFHLLTMVSYGRLLENLNWLFMIQSALGVDFGNLLFYSCCLIRLDLGWMDCLHRFLTLSLVPRKKFPFLYRKWLFIYTWGACRLGFCLCQPVWSFYYNQSFRHNIKSFLLHLHWCKFLSWA